MSRSPNSQGRWRPAITLQRGAPGLLHCLSAPTPRQTKWRSPHQLRGGATRARDDGDVKKKQKKTKKKNKTAGHLHGARTRACGTAPSATRGRGLPPGLCPRRSASRHRAGPSQDVTAMEVRGSGTQDSASRGEPAKQTRLADRAGYSAPALESRNSQSGRGNSAGVSPRLPSESGGRLS